MNEFLYPLSPQGVFSTIQGEGIMMGVPMVFIRLAGCPVGCPECDTNYTLNDRKSASDIARLAVEAGPVVEWAWITGGEPTIYDLDPLFHQLRRAGYRIALATAGTKRVQEGWLGVDFLSVSPHRVHDWVQRAGSQLNLVFGLNDLKPEDVEGELAGLCPTTFPYRYATPCEGKPETLAVCLEWVQTHRGWRLGNQSHKVWGLK